jgi:hypothetical protein
MGERSMVVVVVVVVVMIVWCGGRLGWLRVGAVVVGQRRLLLARWCGRGRRRVMRSSDRWRSAARS